MSKPSETDRRYDRYAEIFENPVTEHEIELGNRVLHWSFMENFQQSTGRGVVQQHARHAQEESLRLAGDDAARSAEEERQRAWSPARHPRRAAALARRGVDQEGRAVEKPPRKRGRSR